MILYVVGYRSIIIILEYIYSSIQELEWNKATIIDAINLHKLNVILLESNENTTTLLTQKGVTITN